MDRKDVDEIIACLPQDRSIYRYFKDYYALQLLAWASGDGVALENLRKGAFAPLLNKPISRPLLAFCGDGRLDATRIASQWCEPSLPFLLTLGRWKGGRHNQTSRPGWNLVLRLNFCLSHDRIFHKRFATHYHFDDLNSYAHPIMEKDERSYYRKTLAWARLDVDMESGECLIEEIQTDWVREAKEESMRLNRCRNCNKTSRFPKCKGYREALTYLDETLAPYGAIWDQAMLSATLYFLIEELGIRDIWYHDWETGNALKGLSGNWLPPRSLYSQLPRRFCFRRVQVIPNLLRSRRTSRRLHQSNLQPYFYQLPLIKENQHA